MQPPPPEFAQSLPQVLESHFDMVERAVLALPVATALGAALAFRPRRRGTPPRSAPVIETQIVLAVVGATVMLVVGSSLARAFGIVGAANLIRYRAKIRFRDIDQAKAREREQLARELHDTVAHHVSGIAIQAQAGRAIAASHPERAVDALAIIEDAATRTLTELRAIVGVLRASQDTEFAPQPGVAEVEQLATDGQTRPCVKVTLSGEFDDLSPAVGAAIYRLAQESITNARRHARHATQVTGAVTCDADRVRLTCGGSQGLEGG